MKVGLIGVVVIVRSLIAFATLIPLVLLMLPGSAGIGVPQADLTFEGNVEIYGPEGGSYRPGEVLTISIMVKNQGSLNAMNIDVLLTIDSEAIKVQTLRALSNASDDIKKVIFTWIATEGVHNIEIRLDPDDTIDEASEDNNVVIGQIRVQDDGGVEVVTETSTTIFPSIILFAVLGGAILFVGGAVVLGVILLAHFVNKK